MIYLHYNENEYLCVIIILFDDWLKMYELTIIIQDGIYIYGVRND